IAVGGGDARGQRRRQGFGADDLSADRSYRYLDAGHLADLPGPATGGVDQYVAADRRATRLHGGDPRAGAPHVGDFGVREYRRAQRPRTGPQSVGEPVRVDLAV